MRIFVAAPPGEDKPPTLPPAARTRWQGMISGRGFSRHRRSDVARNLGACADVLRQGAIGCPAAAADAPRGLIDLLEERLLVAEVEPDARKIRLLAPEIALRGVHRLGDFRTRLTEHRVGRSAQQKAHGGPSALFTGNWKRTTPDIAPRDCAEAGRRLEDVIARHGVTFCADAPRIQPDSCGGGHGRFHRAPRRPSRLHALRPRQSAAMTEPVASHYAYDGTRTFHSRRAPMIPALSGAGADIAEICRRFHVRRLDLFGSAAREKSDFTEQSDIDLLVEYEPGYAPPTLADFLALRDALSTRLGRKVDLVMARGGAGSLPERSHRTLAPAAAWSASRGASALVIDAVVLARRPLGFTVPNRNESAA